MSQIADDSYLETRLQELEAEREYMADYMPNRKPYWLSLRHPRDGEMHWDLWNYAPLAHYDRAIEATREQRDASIRTDGGYSDFHKGTTRSTVYYWLDPDTGAALYHTGVNDEETIPFFADEESAMDYLEKRAEHGDKEAYKGYSLYKARTRKVGDAVDVLTNQSGIADFVPDGGRPQDAHQIPNPKPERVWFWYDPAADYLVQEEIEPYDVRGIFSSENDARRFLDWYAEQYDVTDTSHLELYSADIELEGHGRNHFGDDGIEAKPEMPDQVDFSEYCVD